MLEPIFGSKSREQVLLFLNFREEGFATDMAKFYDTNVNQIQKQLEKLEDGGVAYSKYVGRTRVYRLNPRYPFLKELKILLEKVITFYSKNFNESLIMVRKRPRRIDKPL